MQAYVFVYYEDTSSLLLKTTIVTGDARTHRARTTGPPDLRLPVIPRNLLESNSIGTHGTLYLTEKCNN
jgi:hypothetical protein